MRPLSWSLVLSSALHGGLIALVWLQLTGDRSPSRTVLELIADEAGAAPVAATATRPSRPAPGSSAPPPVRRAPSAERAAGPLAATSPMTEPSAPPALRGAAPLAAATSSAADRPELSPSPSAQIHRSDAGAVGAGADTAEPGPSPAPDVGARGGALVPPRPAPSVPPGYPEAARRAEIQGTTVLRVRVLADGSVGEVRLEQSAGHPELDTAAIEAVRRWRFEPARRGSEPVEVWILLPVRFSLG